MIKVKECSSFIFCWLFVLQKNKCAVWSRSFVIFFSSIFMSVVFLGVATNGFGLGEGGV
jgi:hypothetical protein